MIYVILATGLCTANFIAIALLFRRMRRSLNRQLSDMRAERNSEWILRALQGAPEERARPARAAGGDSHVLPLHPPPVRRKKHLGLYNGGGAIAAALVGMSAIIRCGRQAHGAHLVSTAIGTTALAATTVTALTIAPWQHDIETVPPQPSPTLTATQEPGSGSPAAPTTPAPGHRTLRDTTAPTTGMPSSSLRTPSPESEGSSTAAPSRGAAAGTESGPLPGDAASPTASSSVPSTDATDTESGTCVSLIVLAAHACLAGGG